VVDLRLTVATKRIFDLIITANLVFCAALNTGCTTLTSSRNMTVENAVVGNKFPYSVYLYVHGGREYEVGQLPQITDEDLKKALADSITNTKVFAKIGEAGSTDYRLESIIFSISQWSFKSGVHIEIGWRLIDVESDKILWQELIKTTGEGFSQVNALEAAVKENIQHCLENISALNL
jgi:hypothetical protein